MPQQKTRFRVISSEDICSPHETKRIQRNGLSNEQWIRDPATMLEAIAIFPSAQGPNMVWHECHFKLQRIENPRFRTSFLSNGVPGFSVFLCYIDLWTVKSALNLHSFKSFATKLLLLGSPTGHECSAASIQITSTYLAWQRTPDLGWFSLQGPWHDGLGRIWGFI